MAADPQTDSLAELPPAYQQAIRAEVRDVLRQSGKRIADEQGWTKRDVLQAGGFVALGLAMGGGGLLAATQPARADAAGQVGTQADPVSDLFAHAITAGDGADVISLEDGVAFDHEAVSSATTIGNTTYVYYDSSVAGFTITIPASLEIRGGFLVFIDEGASVASNNVDVTSTNWTVDGVSDFTIDANQSVYKVAANPSQSDWSSRIFTERVDAGTIATEELAIGSADLVASGDFFAAGPTATRADRNVTLSTSNSSYQGNNNYCVFPVQWDQWAPANATTAVYTQFQIDGGGSASTSIRLRNINDGENVFEVTGFDASDGGGSRISRVDNYTPTTTNSQRQLRLEVKTGDATATTLQEYTIALGLQV